jgi:hypothetical protein
MTGIAAGFGLMKWTPSCDCGACRALRADRPSQWEWPPRKLLQKGWAGQTDPDEKAFIRAHAPWAQRSEKLKAQAARNFSGNRAARRDLSRSTPSPAPGSAEAATSDLVPREDG